MEFILVKGVTNLGPETLKVFLIGVKRVEIPSIVRIYLHLELLYSDKIFIFPKFL